MNKPEEDHGHNGLVGSKNNAGGENLLEFPGVRERRRLDSVLGDCHDGAIIEDGNDEHHERREVELPDEGDEHEAEDNTDGDGHGIDGVILHPLEDCAAGQHRAHDHAKARLSQYNVGRTSRGVSSISHCNSDVCLFQSWGIIHTVTGHATDVLLVLQPFYNLVLVLCSTMGGKD